MLASLVTAPGAEGLYGAFLAALMLAIAANDARHYLIPNELTAAAFALALLRAAAFVPDAGAEVLLWPVLRAAAVALPLLLLMLAYRRWRGRDGLGLGDVKLAAVCGAWLDLATVAAVIELAALLAIGAYVANAAWQRKPLRATAFLPVRTVPGTHDLDRLAGRDLVRELARWLARLGHLGRDKWSDRALLTQENATTTPCTGGGHSVFNDLTAGANTCGFLPSHWTRQANHRHYVIMAMARQLEP